MTNLTMFYIVFIAQIFLLSVYFPAKLISRMQYILKHYPKSTHPKLYPKSGQYYQNIIKVLTTLNAMIFILGWVIVYFISEKQLFNAERINPMLPWGYFMIQMIPMFLLNIFGFRMSKLMRKADERSEKKASLAPRSLFQYISPRMLSILILLYLGFVIFAFYLEGFVWEVGSKAFITSLMLLMANGFFLILIFALIYGKKMDPYQSQQDRQRSVSTVINTYCYTMIVSTFFMGFAVAVAEFEMKSMMPVAMSVFLQFIAVVSTGYMLKATRIEDIDFNVYKLN